MESPERRNVRAAEKFSHGTATWSYRDLRGSPGRRAPGPQRPPPWGFEISRARELEFLVGRSGDGHTWLAAMNFGGLAVFRVEDWVNTTRRGALVDR